MVERIRHLLDIRQLTPTQFADAIGIARPIVSHILSGRNKPSLEVVQRILTAMPDLSMPWLLNGTGPMLAVEPAGPATAAIGRSSPPAAQEPAAIPAASPSLASVPVPKPVKSRPIPPPSSPEPQRSTPTGSSAIPKRFTPRSLPSPDTRIEQNAAVNTAPAVEPISAPSPVPLPPPPIAPEAIGIPAEPSTAVQLLAGSDKPIRRIVIFYRDGSFADFQPE